MAAYRPRKNAIRLACPKNMCFNINTQGAHDMNNLTTTVPDPYGATGKAVIAGADPDALSSNLRSFIVENGYGASDIGSRFAVTDADGSAVGDIFYNGKVVAK